MKTHSKNIVSSFCFMLVLVGLLLANLLLPDSEFTFSEKRKLAPFPSFSFSKLIDGGFFEEFDNYTLDQFVFRDGFRTIKAYGSRYLLGQSDNNGIYVINGNISKMIYPINEKYIQTAAEKFNEIADRYLKDNHIYYAVIPDKNYFLAKQNGYLSIDYDLMLNILEDNLTNMRYINLFDTLTIDDYYQTDIHWRQERLIEVADKLLLEMQNDARASEAGYASEELYPFRGSLYGQAALKLKPDTMYYLTSPGMDAYTVYDYETKSNITVYAPEKFGGIDPYDVYLYGAKPLITITNTTAETDRELILFRDSFGSSIAPLLMAGYAKITLVDIRYIASGYLDDYIDFSNNQDVLFLYNTQILNIGYIFK